MSKVNKILHLLFVAPFCFSSYSNASEFSYHSPFSSFICNSVADFESGNAQPFSCQCSPIVSDLGFKLGQSNGHKTQPFQSQYSLVSDLGFKLGPSNENKTQKIKKIKLKISDSLIEFGTNDKYIVNLIRSHKRAKSVELVNKTYYLSYSSLEELESDLGVYDNSQPDDEEVTILGKIQQNFYMSQIQFDQIRNNKNEI